MRGALTRQTAFRTAGAFVLVGLGSFAAFAGSGSAVPPRAPKITHGVRVAPATFDGSVRRLPRPAHGSRLFPAPRVERDAADLQFAGPKHPLPGAVQPSRPAAPVLSAPAPDPTISFKGLDRATGGAGIPPDTVGDVGPTHFIQAVNTSVGIFRKSDGAQLAAFTFNSLWAAANPVTACNSNNEGDPTVVYDPQGDRWIIADFAFAGNGSVGPYFECIAVSKTDDAVNGGWWLYAIRTDDASHPFFADYPKMGIWPDGLYMTANMFQGGVFNEARVWAFNRDDLESGGPVRQVVMDLNSTAYSSLLPSNMRTVSGAPPPGRENILVSQARSQFAFAVLKFHVDYSGSGSTIIGPTNVSEAAYAPAPITVPTPGNAVDSLTDRLMMEAQYANVRGVESVWVNHTVGNPVGIQWAQINVTGGTINTTPVQQQIYAVGDGLHRWMGSLAVDKKGDMALGYSVANATTNPDIRYAGRLSFDPLSSLPQTETSMLAGVTRATQIGNCGPAASICTRWGDYSAMSIDPDGCRFWYTQEYYEATGQSWQTRVGSFEFPSCLKTDQDIAFAALAGKAYGDPDFTVGATASSSLPVSFLASGPCTIGGATVHVTGAGSCTITASQAGDTTFNPAPAVSQTFAITKRSQTIAFAALARRTLGKHDFAVSARATSGLPVTFAAHGGCTVSGATVHLKSAGACTVIAAQAGDANYHAAADVSRTFAIARPPCTVPKVVGAKSTIAKRGCRTGRIGRAYSRKVKKGRVISQGRPAGHKLPARTKVNLVLSRGPKS